MWELLSFSYLNFRVVIQIVVNLLNPKQVTVVYLTQSLAKYLIFNCLRNWGLPCCEALIKDTPEESLQITHSQFLFWFDGFTAKYFLPHICWQKSPRELSLTSVSCGPSRTSYPSCPLRVLQGNYVQCWTLANPFLETFFIKLMRCQPGSWQLCYHL